MIAAQLNELGVSQDRRSRQQNGKSSGSSGVPPAAAAVVDTDSDSESDELVRNDGTLPASEPPKPL